MSLIVDDPELQAKVAEVLNRFPAAGLAVGVVGDGSLAWFHGQGLADVSSQTPVTGSTVFPIASITKTFTAIAVMQLWELGLIDLDTPAGNYLRSYRLVPARVGFPPATVRHLLTHTAGVRAVRTAADLLRPEMGWAAPAGRPAPSLAEYYRGGLRYDTEPGTRWAYSNHGYATLGQIVADVSGLPYDRYLRQHIFAPLGMDDSDAVLSDRLRPRLATGYNLKARGPAPVPHHEVITAGGGAVYSTANDMARYAAALLNGGAGPEGAVLRPETLERMFAPHYQSDPRLPGMGLGFFREELGGHRTVEHDGILNGFRTDLRLALDDGIGVVVLANSGGFDPRGVSVPVSLALLRLLLDLPADVVAAGVPERPWAWGELCGWYSFGPGVLTDPQPRMAFGGGVEVVARGGHLWARGQMPIPALRRGLRLYPEADDPDAFRVDLSVLGLGTCPVVFSRGPDGKVTALHLGLIPMSFRKRPDRLNPRRLIGGMLAGGAAALVLRRRRASDGG